MESSRIKYLIWPGLARLWGPGQWRGLALALCFAVLLNGALLASWGEVGELERGARWSLWAVILGIWLFSARDSHRWLSWRASLPKSTDLQPLFQRAQNEYLQGHWVAAEVSLRELLSQSEGDTEARLLLATLYRRTGRVDLAREQLSELARKDGAERWRLEINREWEFIARETEQPLVAS